MVQDMHSYMLLKKSAMITEIKVYAVLYTFRTTKLHTHKLMVT